MSFEFNWIEENLIYELRLTGTMTVEDLLTCHNIEIGWLEQNSEHQLSGIIDFTDVRNFHVDLMNLTRHVDMKRIRKTQAQRGWIVFVGLNDPVLRFMIMSLVHTFHLKFRHATTVDEAKSYLAETLPHAGFATKAQV